MDTSKKLPHVRTGQMATTTATKKAQTVHIMLGKSACAEGISNVTKMLLKWDPEQH